MNNYKKILQPQYYSKFSCIGSDCEDTCCNGWNVFIDKDTYKKYRKCKDVNLKPLLDKKVTRNRRTASNVNYAKIVLSEGRCPFLSEEHLCVIQKTLGEEYLSVTCTTYPRTVQIVNGVVERSLLISCPVAARLALLNPSAMEFDENKVDSIPIDEETSVINTLEYKRSSKPYQYFWELRGFTIFILQNRKYPLWQRLIILGLFYDQLNQAIIEERHYDIPELISTYSNRIDEGVFYDELEKIPNQITMQLQLLSILIDFRIATGVIVDGFQQCLNEFSKGIQHTSEMSEEEMGFRYAEAYSQFYKPFMDQHEHIMENYLVNYVFRNIFPFGSQKNVYDEYVLLIIHYAIIKSLLIGMAGYHKTAFDIDHVIKLIQSFSKAIEHHSPYLKNIFQFFEDNDLKNSACMAVLIKN